MGRTALKYDGKYYVKRLEFSGIVILENLLTGEMRTISKNIVRSDKIESVWLDITVKEYGA